MLGQFSRSTIVLVACLASTLVPRGGAAQAMPRLEVWERVRVSHADPCCRSPQTGRLLAFGADSIVLITGRPPLEERVALPRSSVRILEHGSDAGSYALRGGMLGLLAGVATAGVTLGLMSRECEDICAIPILAIYAVPAGAAIGGFIGGLIGHTVRRIEWRRVPVPVRVGPNR